MSNSFVGATGPLISAKNAAHPGRRWPHILRGRLGGLPILSLVSVTPSYCPLISYGLGKRIERVALYFICLPIDFELDLSFVRIFVRTCLNVFGLTFARDHPKYSKPGSKS